MLSRIIKNLAETYHSESFQPHLTLAGVPDWTEEQMVHGIKRLAATVSPLELSLEKIHCKRSPYQKITIEVERSGALNTLHQKIDKLFGGNYSKTKYPHISLLYSRLECNDLQQVASEIKYRLPPKSILDRIALIRCKGTPEEWRTLYIGKMEECKL